MSLQMNAEVEVFGEKFTVTNKDTFTWRDPLFIISSGGTSCFYRISTENFAAGDHKVYSIDKFVNAEGKNFDSKNSPISVVTIQAKNEQGKDYGYRYYF